MLFKELSKLLDSITKFIYGFNSIDESMSERERKYILSQLRKAGIRIEE